MIRYNPFLLCWFGYQITFTFESQVNIDGYSELYSHVFLDFYHYYRFLEICFYFKILNLRYFNILFKMLHFSKGQNFLPMSYYFLPKWGICSTSSLSYSSLLLVVVVVN